MLVRGLLLDGVKCFSHSDIDLCVGKETPHKWVVIYGDNGLGKSTLLKSFGIALTGQPALNALLPSAEGWVRDDRKDATITVDAQKGPGDIGIGPRAKQFCVMWRLVGNSPLKKYGDVLPAHSIDLNIIGDAPGLEIEAKQIDRDAKLFKKQVANDEPRRGWLICGYGPHRRLSGAASDVAERIPPDGRAARLVTLFHEKAALTSAERWLRELHHHALIDRRGPARRQLDVIIQMINTGLSHGGIELADSGITPETVYFKTPFNPRVPMEDLSDGYRTVLALALDLLRHVAYCFDIETVLETQGDRTIITAEGVVLIDEIDAHLHPSWQRTIGAWLHERFPNMQFIVATHSPLIATRVSEDEGMVVRLVRRLGKDGDVVDAITEEGTIGLSADQNLTGPNFGLTSTRDVLTDELVAEVDRLRKRARAKKATPAERKRLGELEAEFERLAPATPTHSGMEGWRDESERIQRVSEKLAKKEKRRR